MPQRIASIIVIAAALAILGGCVRAGYAVGGFSSGYRGQPYYAPYPPYGYSAGPCYSMDIRPGFRTYTC